MTRAVWGAPGLVQENRGGVPDPVAEARLERYSDIFFLETVAGLDSNLTPHNGAEFSCASVFPSVQWG